LFKAQSVKIFKNESSVLVIKIVVLVYEVISLFITKLGFQWNRQVRLARTWQANIEVFGLEKQPNFKY
jgi:hypothetical protein